ncbi:MAG: Asparagine synthetase, glutamine-hydrolyzing, partial [Paenibacillus sp.]|nr:Asparagine synthetase, glutamine-hydrolyzing [Paenibacillus sp.]
TIPTDYRLGGGTTKYIFRKAMEGIIPEFILDRPKLGFPVPLRSWLKGDRGNQLLEQIQGSGIDSVIRMSEAERMLKQHQSGQADHSRLLWAIYMFALWHSTYLQEAKSTRSERSFIS